MQRGVSYRPVHRVSFVFYLFRTTRGRPFRVDNVQQRRSYVLFLYPWITPENTTPVKHNVKDIYAQEKHEQLELLSGHLTECTTHSDAIPLWKFLVFILLSVPPGMGGTLSKMNTKNFQRGTGSEWVVHSVR
jgi:hypothetical protein